MRFPLLLAFLPIAAAANDAPPAHERRDLRVTIGVATGFAPEYAGGDHYQVKTLPLIDIRYKDIVRVWGTKAQINLMGIGAKMEPGRWRLRAGPVIAWNPGRDADGTLTGLEDVKSGIEAGGFAEIRNGPLAFTVEALKSTRSGNGMMARVSGSMGLYRGERLQILGAARLRFADSESMSKRYGVSATGALNTGLSPYRAKGGFEGASLQLLSRYRLNDHWRLEAILAFDHLMGPAARSPLVKDIGSRNGAILGLGIDYTF